MPDDDEFLRDLNRSAGKLKFLVLLPVGLLLATVLLVMFLLD